MSSVGQADQVDDVGAPSKKTHDDEKEATAYAKGNALVTSTGRGRDARGAYAAPLDTSQSALRHVPAVSSNGTRLKTNSARLSEPSMRTRISALSGSVGDRGRGGHRRRRPARPPTTEIGPLTSRGLSLNAALATPTIFAGIARITPAVSVSCSPIRAWHRRDRPLTDRVASGGTEEARLLGQDVAVAVGLFLPIFVIDRQRVTAIGVAVSVSV